MQRVRYIDIAKAIAVLFIILGHLGLVFNADVVPGGVPHFVTRFAFTFHLPVFFVLSGYFLRADEPLSGNGIKKSARSLLVPYVWACVFVVVGTTAVAVLTPGVPAIDMAVRWIEASLWGAGSTHPHALIQTERIGGIWFLLALFWIRLIIPATRKIDTFPRFILMFGLLVLSVFIARYVWLPWSVLSGIGCAFYVYVGVLCRKYRVFDRIHGWMWLVPIALWAVVIVYGGSASLAMCGYPLGLLDVAGGIAGCLCVVRLSRAIDDHADAIATFAAWIGRNTLPIFALHIVEDNIIPWWYWGQVLSQATGGFTGDWLILLIVRLAVDALLVGLVYLVPVTRRAFFPHAKVVAAWVPRHAR